MVARRNFPQHWLSAAVCLSAFLNLDHVLGTVLGTILAAWGVGTMECHGSNRSSTLHSTLGHQMHLLKSERRGLHFC